LATLITFSSDYGPTDEFVGVCHLTIARIAPDVRVVDVVHGIRGVRAGSAVLAQSLIESPEDAIHLVVVDPGVGTDRKAVAIVLGNGGKLVGPDNGVFFPVADSLGGALEAYELTEPWFMRSSMSRTFHGRDIFAPTAAHLALDVPIQEFGPPVDPAALVRLEPALVHVEEGLLEAEVLRTDWYGNIQTAAEHEHLAASRLSGRIEVNGVEAVIAEKFADVPEGQMLVYVNSAGHVALAQNRGSARDALQAPERVTLKSKM
jgi:S-adenosyl-L-methionine hydrolase (adenosine-forming)